MLDVMLPDVDGFDIAARLRSDGIETPILFLTARSGGHRDFTINAGGDIAIRGHAAPDTPWTVGIRHPDDRDALATVLDVVGPAAVATSATYERGAHIIDPRTGRPTTELASVTVVGTALTLVDAYATAIFVMGLPGLEWLARHPGHEALAITHDARVHLTPGFNAWRRPQVERTTH